jgi:hypothetical protein
MLENLQHITITIAQAQQILPILAVVMFGWTAKQVWDVISGKH